jgi:alcohol dehydrogenase class IV
MEFNFDVCKQQYAALAYAIGKTTAKKDEAAARDLIRAVADLLSNLKLPNRLKDLVKVNISKQDLEFLAESASLDPATMFNPRECNAEDLHSIYEKCM